MKFFNPLIILFLIVAGSCSTNTNEKESIVTVFEHGVASGDPLTDQVIVWTKVTPRDSSLHVEVNWELAANEAFDTVLKYGKYTTSADRNFTVKIDLKGLNPDTKYYYRFSALGDTSIVGKTKTAPAYSDSLQFAVVSCSNYQWGYFNAYGRIADRENLDAVIHLGDYIYEHGVDGYGDTTIGRLHEPPVEILTLDDYRIRYAQYRKDKDLIAVHANHPFIVIWDDHEIANNAYVEGAENHQEHEGSYIQRKAAARKAYYEWMPIREGEKLYRKFSFGKMADLIMLDERLEGRSEQLSGVDNPDYPSEKRSMLGPNQLEWFQSNIRNSNATWKVIGNQVIFSDRILLSSKNPKSMDAWDGYPAEKNKIAHTILDEGISDVIWITGDTHSSWIFNTVVQDVSDTPIAVEFGGTSVNSGNYGDRVSRDTVRMVEAEYLKNNPHLKYTNLADHGYFLLTLTNDQARVQYYYSDTVKEPSNKERLGYEGVVASGVPEVKTINQ